MAPRSRYDRLPSLPVDVLDLDDLVTARPRDATLLFGASRAPVGPDEHELDDTSDDLDGFSVTEAW